MHRLDMIAEAFRLLGEALPYESRLEPWEEWAVKRATQIEKENRAQQLLPLGRQRAATLLDCSERNVYYLAEQARERESIERQRQKVATTAA
jgi:hypothetical protein